MTITIDGRLISFEGRPTLLEVARANDIFVPSLCDHPALEPYAACRLCLVEVQGRRGFVPACSTIAEEGQVVRTATPELAALRRGILELILAEHPHACLICSEKSSCDDFKSTIRKTSEVTGCVLCPANARCQLQRVVAAVGMDVVLFPSHRRPGEVRRDDPFIDRDNSLCILCGRCVRVCREVRGASVLTFVYRGSDTVVGTALDRRLVDSGCQFCGACVDVCPTGSLAERAVRYDLLPEADEKTICPLCGQGCGLTVGLRGGRIVGTSPDPDGPVNRGQACVRGRFVVRSVVDHGRRLQSPLIRENGSLRKASWEEALTVAATRLAGIGPGELAVTASAQSSCEDLFVLHKFATNAGKAARVEGSWSGSAAAALCGLGRASRLTIPLNFRLSDIGLAGAIVVLGEDLRINQPIVGLEVHKAVEKGAALIHIAVSDSRPWPRGGDLLRVPPGKNELLLTVLAALAAKPLRASLAESSGADGFLALLQAVDISRSARALSLSARELREAALRLSASKAPTFLLGSDFVSGEKDLGGLAALWNLARLVGGRIIPLSSEANTRGGIEIAEAFAARPRQAAGQVKASGHPRSRALYLAGPLSQLEPGAAELVIVQASYGQENIEAADIVLPETTSFETEGTLVNIEGRIQVSCPAIAPLGEAKPGWWILKSLAARLGAAGFSFESAADVRQELASVPAFGMIATAFSRQDDAFLVEGAAGAGAYLDPKAAQSWDWRRPPLASPKPDEYKGLNMAQENKSLRLVRGR